MLVSQLTCLYSYVWTLEKTAKITSLIKKWESDYGLIVLEASKEGLFSNVFFGKITEKVARYPQLPLMIFQHYEGPVKSLVKTIMG